VFYEKTYERTSSPIRSRWWLIAKNGTDHTEVFTLDGSSTLPVFSSEDEAEMYLWFEDACGDGWEARRSTSEELVAMLCGPCSGVGAVVLDPSPEIIDGWPARTVNLDRRRFVEWMVDSLRKEPGSMRVHLRNH